MGRSLRDRYIFFTTISLLFIFLTSYYWRNDISDVSTPIFEEIHDNLIGPTTTAPYPKYKPTPPARSLPIVDNFPHALAAHAAADLPPIPSWNNPPTPHVLEKTPLFIGFTRNWRLLQQVVVSYITSGWPPEDIYVVENTGVMDSNKQGRLSLQNPFFLNHTRLEMLGVNVLVTPTLLTFAQLQSFYMFHSISQDWSTYFWSHMDVVSVSFEDQYYAFKQTTTTPILPSSDSKHDYSDYESVYTKCLDALRNVTAPDPATGKLSRWAMRFFSYDRLALVNVASFVEVGGWDTLIPFYMTDCDMHARLEMAHFDIKEVPAGLIYDVASSLDDLIVLYRKTGPETPEASFKDPNAIEEELKAIAESEAAASKAGLGENNEEVKKTEKRDEDKTESDIQAEKAWEKFAEGQKPPGGAGSTTSTSTSTSTISPATATPTPESSGEWTEDTIFSPAFQKLMQVLDRMQGSKHENTRGRNTWQSRQVGGQGDPFYRDSEGFDQGIQMTIEHGRRVFADKWGHRDCDIVAKGLVPEDAWRVEHDWD
ncbi:uncharacterized protein LY89DRAFT_678740 [Mollisia scopiformis]|uniref:Uncharacterized protein n=1 Tax=Mollisia scopiformis TaxID=149040 RepID=A0A132B252_MOLSC|nr:uncharacterized protein LY89DRAFT_678740 [Mollisia scopiformis]KUJ06475.1 hypothetical protein LY89DRAFT_678740 [Mollisia scopiformis]